MRDSISRWGVWEDEGKETGKALQEKACKSQLLQLILLVLQRMKLHRNCLSPHPKLHPRRLKLDIHQILRLQVQQVLYSKH
jgi:hypothetical protein